MEKRIYLVERTRFEEVNGIMTQKSTIMMAYDSLDKAIQHIKVTAAVYENPKMYEEDSESIHLHFLNKGVREMETIDSMQVF